MTRRPMRPRAVKVPDDLWNHARAVAAGRDEVLSEEIRKFLKGYVKRGTK